MKLTYLFLSIALYPQPWFGSQGSVIGGEPGQWAVLVLRHVQPLPRGHGECTLKQ